MAKNDANKEGRFLGPRGGTLTTVGVLNNNIVTGGKRPLEKDGRTSRPAWDVPYSDDDIRTGAVKSVPNSRAR